MIVKLRQFTPESEVQALKKHLHDLGFEIHESKGAKYQILGIVGDTAALDQRNLYVFECVEQVIRIQEPFKKVNRRFKETSSIIDVAGIPVGGNKIVVIAGPCSVENESQVDIIAKSVQESGATMYRAGAYKPRSSPYSFQGLETEGLKILAESRTKYKMPIVSEIMSVDKIDEFLEYVDLIQVGARNMQNFALLKELGKIKKPILLKRGLSATIEEWLMAAEYIVASGNPNVILCERGIRTFETYTRNSLDISSIPVVKKLSHLPIIVDPSHAVGRWDLVEDVAKAAIAAGADGLMIEVHHDPENALSDGAQSLKLEKFKELMEKVRKVAVAIDRTI
ncbi:MAG TPA: 3-deoxy-7-phosphoheptulonate synthase [Bacilli bacterium]|nr:3-deoxy-7-phosphoheptulonate synthase [Bacilli bacterium]